MANKKNGIREWIKVLDIVVILAVIIRQFLIAPIVVDILYDADFEGYRSNDCE